MQHGGAGELLALAVDELEGELELVVKELGAFLGRLPTVAGATIDGDGSVVLVLDVRELAVRQLASAGGQAPVAATAPAVTRRRRRCPRAASTDRPRVLVVEDSVGVRELQRVILEGAGYDVQTAVDGLDGASRLTRTRSTWCCPTSRCPAWTASRSPARSAGPAAGRTSRS